MGVIPPDHHRSAPGAWTPISALLASAPIVPVLGNGQWCITTNLPNTKSNPNPNTNPANKQHHSTINTGL